MGFPRILVVIVFKDSSADSYSSLGIFPLVLERIPSEVAPWNLPVLFKVYFQAFLGEFFHRFFQELHQGKPQSFLLKLLKRQFKKFVYGFSQEIFRRFIQKFHYNSLFKKILQEIFFEFSRGLITVSYKNAHYGFLKGCSSRLLQIFDQRFLHKYPQGFRHEIPQGFKNSPQGFRLEYLKNIFLTNLLTDSFRNSPRDYLKIFLQGVLVEIPRGIT